MLTHELLCEFLRYNPETGLWTWIKAPAHKPQLLGEEAGHLATVDNARRIMFQRVMYRASRLAWFYMTGEWPVAEIDHKDRNPSNDSWENLREATSSENKCNTGISKRNTSGVRGVSWMEGRQKWRVEVDGIHIGVYNTLEEAADVRDCVAKKSHKEFAFLNTELQS